jgi:hypothetical protein
MHAALVVRAGWTFCRRMLDNLKGRKPFHHFYLSPGAFRDLLFWERALKVHTGEPLPIIAGLVFSYDLVCFSDATPQTCAFVVGDEWIQHHFTNDELPWHINKKELHAIVLGVTTFPDTFRDKRVRFRTDSHSSVVGARRMFVSDPQMMDGYRHL